jgi:hypothetical protein
LQISADGLKPIAKIDVLRWNVDLKALYEGIDIPGHIDINELVIDTSFIDGYVGIINTDGVLSNIGISGLLALKSLSINRTKLIGEQSLDLAPMELKRNEQKISLSMRDESIFSSSQVPKLGSSVRINTSIDVAKARQERVAVIPFSINNEDFNLSAQVKIFNQQDQVFLDFESYIDQIEVNKISQNIPESLADSRTVQWIETVLTEGSLTDIMLTTRFNMSGEIESPNTKFSANLNGATISADPKWPSIENINAKVNFSNDYLKIVGNQASVEDIDLSYLSITTRDFSQPDSTLSLNARFNSESLIIEDFIKKSSVSEKIKAYLEEFELKGKLWGNVNMVVPTQRGNDQKLKLSFDMFASDNSLSVLDGKLKIDDFNSQISYSDGLIRTKGKGLIGQELFQISLNPKDWIDEQKPGSAPQKLLSALQSVLKAVHLKTNQDIPNDVSDVSPSEIHNIIADDLIASENGVIVLGEHLNSNPNSLAIINLIEKIASATNLKIANITISGNSHSAEKANFIPSGNGLNAISMFNDNTKAFLLMDVDSEYDFIDSKSAQGHFSKEDVFVVALSSFENQSTLTSADVILPMASFYESSGTHINFDGLVQSYSASVKSPGESKPGWKIIKVMADLLDLQGFDYVDSTQVKEEALQSSKVKSSVDEANIQSIDDSQVTTHWQYAPYASDSVTRRAKALQESNVGMINRAYVSKMTAHKIGLSDDDLYLGVPVSIEESVAEDCVFIHTNQARRA